MITVSANEQSSIAFLEKECISKGFSASRRVELLFDASNQIDDGPGWEPGSSDRMWNYAVNAFHQLKKEDLKEIISNDWFSYLTKYANQKLENIQ